MPKRLDPPPTPQDGVSPRVSGHSASGHSGQGHSADRSARPRSLNQALRNAALVKEDDDDEDAKRGWRGENTAEAEGGKAVGKKPLLLLWHSGRKGWAPSDEVKRRLSGLATVLAVVVG
eukprot:719080-Prorocentrum_minimum.AAC.1